jgi:hypothetical protein
MVSAKNKSLKANQLIKLIIGYVEARNEGSKMKGLPDIYLKTKSIQELTYVKFTANLRCL